MRRIGAVFRSYSKTPEGVDEVVDRAVKSARRAVQVSMLSRILFMVSAEQDCGQTAKRLSVAVADEGIRAVVMEARGDPNSTMLNTAARLLLDDETPYALFLSNKAIEFLTEDLISRMMNEMRAKVRVVGVRIEDLADVAEMPIQNTFALWHIPSLIIAGGFDSKIGVEEVAPIARIARRDGHSLLGWRRPVAMVVRPAEHTRLQIRISAEGRAHHAQVKSSKRERQEQEAARLGVSLEWVNRHIVII